MEKNPEDGSASNRGPAALQEARRREAPPTLFKYLPTERIDVLESLRIRFSQPASFNDPFDSRPPAGLVYERGMRKPLREELIDSKGRGPAVDQSSLSEGFTPFEALSLTGGYASRREAAGVGILSLSERRDSLLMWSHYASSHRGLVIGLDSKHDFLAGGDDVQVLDEHPGLMLAPFGLEATGPSVCAIAYVQERLGTLPAPGFRLSLADCISKGTDWEYEKEWRAFRSLSSFGRTGLDGEPIVPRAGYEPRSTGVEDLSGCEVVLFDIPPAAITEVILGLNASLAERQRVAKCLFTNPELRHVKLIEAGWAPHTFGLTFLTLDDPEVLLRRDATPPSSRVQAEDATAVETDLREALAKQGRPFLHHMKSLLLAEDQKVARYREHPERGIPLMYFVSTIPRELLIRTVDEALESTQAQAWDESILRNGPLDFEAIRAQIKLGEAEMNPKDCRTAARFLLRASELLGQQLPSDIQTFVKRHA